MGGARPAQPRSHPERWPHSRASFRGTGLSRLSQGTAPESKSRFAPRVIRPFGFRGAGVGDAEATCSGPSHQPAPSPSHYPCPPALWLPRMCPQLPCSPPREQGVPGRQAANSLGFCLFSWIPGNVRQESNVVIKQKTSLPLGDNTGGFRFKQVLCF